MIKENEIAKIAVDVAFGIYQELGPGLLENIYESVFAMELESRGLRVERQVPCKLIWKGVSIGDALKMDLLVNDLVVIELKSTEKHEPVHAKQLLTYLRISGKKLGLLVNFGCATFKDGIRRIINGKLD